LSLFCHATHWSSISRQNITFSLWAKRHVQIFVVGELLCSALLSVEQSVIWVMVVKENKITIKSHCVNMVTDSAFIFLINSYICKSKRQLKRYFLADKGDKGMTLKLRNNYESTWNWLIVNYTTIKRKWDKRHNEKN
jgi:hypothetical protein